MGRLAEYVEAKFGVRTDTRENPLVSSVGVSPERICRSEPDRLALMIFNLSVNEVYLGWFNDVSSTKCVLLPSNGGCATFIADEDLELVGREFWAAASAADSAIFVMEILAI